MVTLTIQECPENKIRLNPADAASIGIEVGQILVVTEPNTGKRIVGISDIDPRMSSGMVEMDRVSFESVGLEVGFPVDVSTHTGRLVPVTSIEFGISADPAKKLKREDVLISVKNHEKELLRFMGHRVFNINSRFKWDELDIYIDIKDTTPKLIGDDVARFGELRAFTYSWAGGEMKSFDGVLLIDISGTMNMDDVVVQDVGFAIERMKGELRGPYCSKFLSKFREGENVRRYEAATICALLYLVEKIGRGVGDNIAIIPFSDEAFPLEFNGRMFYSSRMGDTSGAAETIIRRIETEHHGLTNMAQALSTGIEIAKNFDPGRIKMFVLLTDGKPDDPEKVLEIVDRRLSPRMDVIVNTLGLGEKSDEQILNKIARISGGQYNKVSGLKELARIYSGFALNLKIRGSAATIGEWAKGDGSEFAQHAESMWPCPTCHQPLTYVPQYNRWYCYNCRRYA